MYSMIVFFSISVGGSSHVSSELFGPFVDLDSCEFALENDISELFGEPQMDDGPNAEVVQAYCIPGETWPAG